MRTKEEIMLDVKNQRTDMESPEMYQTRIIKSMLEVFVDIRDMFREGLDSENK